VATDEHAVTPRDAHPIGSPPCNGCTECCKRTLVFVFRDEPLWNDPRLEQVDGLTDQRRVPMIGEDQHCVFLGPSGCTVYGNRPEMCRAFDCRDMLLRMGGANRQARRALSRLSPAQRKGAELLHTLPQMNLTSPGSRAGSRSQGARGSRRRSQR
jgi:hypothetical protein